MLISLVPIVGSMVLLVFHVSEGDPGRNRYGPPPGHMLARPDAGAIPSPPPAQGEQVFVSEGVARMDP